MAVVARCPGCRKTFPWNPANGLPERCPLPGCNYVAAKRDPETDEDGVIVIAAPFIGSARTKQTDASYRELETSSAARAELAAQAAGVPVSEMSHLKVTNIRDNTRPGEVAAMPVVNDVTKQMDRMKASGMPVGFGDQQFAHVGASTGYVGTRAMETSQSLITKTLGSRPYSTKVG